MNFALNDLLQINKNVTKEELDFFLIIKFTLV